MPGFGFDSQRLFHAAARLLRITGPKLLTRLSDLALHHRCRSLRTPTLSGRALAEWIDRCRIDLERLPPCDHRTDAEAILEALLVSESYRKLFGQGDGRKIEDAILGGARTLLRLILDDDPVVGHVLALPEATGDPLVDRARAAFQVTHDFVAGLRGLDLPI